VFDMTCGSLNDIYVVPVERCRVLCCEDMGNV
jgi:hypothetical protein